MMSKYILDEKLSHLDDMQISALVKRYYKGEKIFDLLKEFNIQCLPSAFHKLLPHVIDSSEKCPACNSPMANKLESKSGLGFSKDAVKCSQCKHIDFHNCDCEYCLDLKSKLKVSHQVSMKILIDEYCKTFLSQPVFITVHDITLEMAVALLALVRTCHQNKDGTYGSIIKNLFPYTPRSNLLTEKLLYLLDKEVIYPAANSNIDAFNLKNGKIESFKLLEVDWALNCFHAQLLIAEIENCGLSGIWPESWYEEVDKLKLELALAECQEYYEFCLDQRRLPYTNGPAINNMLINILRDHSVAQCYRIIWCGATASSDFKARSQANSMHTMNYMAGACLRWADKSRAEGWPVEPFRRNFNLPRSMLSYVLYDVMLKMGERGFNEVIKLDDEAF